MNRSRPASSPLSRRAWLATALSAIPVMSVHAQAAAESNRITIYGTSGGSPTPIHLAGFSGEVASTLRFDLEVAGCRIAPETEAQLSLLGSNTPNVEGRLLDRNKASLLAKGYSGGSPRQQAHALADDVIKAMGGQGVAQTRIAFKCEVTQGKSEIYVADYDGYGAQKVTSDGSIVAAPTWVPGRRTLLYTSYRLGNPDIFIHDLSTGSRKPLSRQAGLNTSAAASADGQRVAMILSKDGSPNLYVGRMDGSGTTRVTDNRQGDSSPCWSPDGKTLCYSSRSGGPSTLFLISASGGAPRRLRLAGVSNATEPDWSPDGQTIVFTTQSGRGFEVCVVPAGGGDVTRLVEGEDPVWAPNSRTVIYARRVGKGVRVLSLLDVPTRQTKDLPRLSGSCSQPTWAR
jgi:TolB protein